MLNKTYKKYSWIAIFLFVFIIALILRLPLITSSDYRYDEAFTALTIRVSWGELLTLVANDKFFHLLYYLVLKVWTMVFSTSHEAIRWFSVFWGMALLPLVYAITQQLKTDIKDKKFFGLFAISILAISPFYVTYSADARSYTFLAFLILLSLYFFFKIYQKTKYVFVYIFAFLATLLAIILTHYVSIIVVAGYTVAIGLNFLVEKELLWNGKVWGYITLVIFFCWLVFTKLWTYLGLWKVLVFSNLGWIPSSDLASLVRIFYAFLFGVDRQASGIPPVNHFSIAIPERTVGMVVFTSFVVLTVLAIVKFKQDKEKLKHILVLLSVSLVPLFAIFYASSLGIQVYVDRYVIGYGTILLLSLSYAGWEVIGRSFSSTLIMYIALLYFIVLPKGDTKYSDIQKRMPMYSQDVKIVVQSPMDFVIFKSYFGDRKLYVLKENDWHFYNWALVREYEEIPERDLKTGDIVIISEYANRTMPKEWEKQFSEVDMKVLKVQ